MIQLPQRFHLPVPEHWTPQQALAVFALLHDLSAAVWQRYETDLLPLIDPALNTDTDPQLDLFGPDDELPSFPTQSPPRWASARLGGRTTRLPPSRPPWHPWPAANSTAATSCPALLCLPPLSHQTPQTGNCRQNTHEKA